MGVLSRLRNRHSDASPSAHSSSSSTAAAEAEDERKTSADLAPRTGAAGAPLASNGPGGVAGKDPNRRTSSIAYIDTPFPLVTWRTLILGSLVSMGGLIFGYDTGQISGFLEMRDFLERFGQLRPDPKNPGGPETYQFTNVRSGLIVGMLSIGTLVGALIAAPFANRFGRKYSISAWCVIFCVGVIVQIAAEYNWKQVVAGRIVAGLGVGALSILVPLFQSETAPSHVRGAIVWYVNFSSHFIFLFPLNADRSMLPYISRQAVLRIPPT